MSLNGCELSAVVDSLELRCVLLTNQSLSRPAQVNPNDRPTA